KESGDTDHADAVEWENILQLTEPGEHFVDFGWFAELSTSLQDQGIYAFETGPMFEKQFGRLVNTLDLLGERVFGKGISETETSYRFQSQYRSGSLVELGIQAFGQKGEDEPAQHVAGPAVFS